MGISVFISRRKRALEMTYYYLITEPFRDVKLLVGGCLMGYYLRRAVKEAGDYAIGDTKAWAKYIKVTKWE